MSDDLLKKRKLIDSTRLTAKQTILYLGIYFIFGNLLGVIAKYSDTIPSNSGNGIVYSFISEITTNLGLWVLLATLITFWSRSPTYAALNVLTFFIGMLTSYYIYSHVLFGFFPTHYFVRWGSIALASPICAYIVWFSRGEGWGSSLCAALPIGFLLTQGMSFFYIPSVVLGFDLFSGILLLIILTKSTKQYLKVIPMTILIVLIIRNTDVIYYLFGGL
ncbi:hypothetical protein [Bacillus coreaensis]